MRKPGSLFPVLLLFAFTFAACSSSPSSPGETADSVAITVNALTHGFGTSAPAEPNMVRVTARDSGGTVLDTGTASISAGVDGEFGPFSLSVPGNPVHAVDVELFHSATATEILWSGSVKDLSLPAGESATVDVDLFRGALSNLELTSLSLIGLPSQMQVGTATTLSAAGSPSEIEPHVFWGSLASDIATVSHDGIFTAAQPGEAAIVVAGGTRSDTVTVTVTELEPDPGEHGSSRTFDRTGQQWIEVSTPAALSFADDAWTFAIWVRPGDVEGDWFHYAVSSGAVFEGNGAAGGGPGFQVYYGETENVHHWHVAVNNDDGIGGHHVLPASPRPTSGAWTHVALRYDGVGELTAFLNGAPQGTFDFSGPVTLPDPIHIGRRADGDEDRYLDGQIGHLARWDGALSDAAISDLARGMHPQAAAGGDLSWFIPLGLDPEEGFGPVGETLGFELTNGPAIGSAPPVSDPPSG